MKMYRRRVCKTHGNMPWHKCEVNSGTRCCESAFVEGMSGRTADVVQYLWLQFKLVRKLEALGHGWITEAGKVAVAAHAMLKQETTETQKKMKVCIDHLRMGKKYSMPQAWQAFFVNPK